MTPLIFVYIISLRVVLISGDVYYNQTICWEVGKEETGVSSEKGGLWRKKLCFLKFNSDPGEHLGVGAHYFLRCFVIT